MSSVVSMALRDLVFLLILGCASSLYEREAGHYDWKVGFVGRPVGMLGSFASHKTCIVASEAGVVASLDVFSGALLWKVSPYSSTFPVTGMFIDASEQVVSVTYDGAESVNIHLADGSVTQGPKSSHAVGLSMEPITVGEVVVRVLPGDVLVGERDHKRIWSREESVASADSAVMVREGNLAVVHSKLANRLVGIDLSSGGVIWAADASENTGLIEEAGEVFLSSSDGQSRERVDVETGKLENLVESPTSKAFEYRLDESTGEATGFGQGGQVQWKVHLHEKILSIASPTHANLGKVSVLVKGDASVVFKYMNPNLLVLLTSGTAGLTLTGLDTVTGALPFQVVFANATEPAHTLLCDNWVVVHYFNPVERRFEVGSIDLFEKREDSFSLLKLLTGSFRFIDDSATDSAFQLPSDPIIAVQQWIFPLGPISALSVTASLKGITPRQVVFATNKGLLAIRKDTWLNPRRVGKAPIHPKLKSAADETLPPYSPVLPVIATDFVSHVHLLEGVRLVVSSATHLESTSIVCAFGVDLFCTPVSIGNAPYDQLSPFFNYWLLYVSVAAVGSAVVVSAMLARRKELYNKWK